MARLALPVLPLALALAACGGSDSAAQTQGPERSGPPRAPIAVFTPAKGKVLDAQPYVAGRLETVVRVSGRAAPGQQLSLLGSCGGYSCDGITFADSTGRWRTRVELVTPSKRKKAVTLTVAYADARSGEHPASVALRLRKAAAPPQAAPEQNPPPSSSTTTTTTGGQPAPATGGSTAPYSGARTMIVIGDSLAIGMAPTLRGLLPDWDVAIDGRTGRPLAEGMEILAETPMPTGSRASHAILAFSLGTNDGPENADALEAAVRRSMTYLGAHGCALWATIARPPLGGVSYRAMNDRLAALAAEPELYGRLLVVDWKREYDRHKSWRRGDGVHATPEGYAGRAQLYAQAAAGCPA